MEKLRTASWISLWYALVFWLMLLKWLLMKKGSMFLQTRKGGKTKDSDHVTIYIDLDLKIMDEKPERREIFKFKDEEALANFKKITSETKEFSDCFKDKLPVLQQIERWRGVLKSHCSKTFKKIRISKNKKFNPIKGSLARLVDERNKLVNLNDGDKHEDEIKRICEKIYNLEAEENRNLIIKNFKTISDDPENINLQQVWKTLKKIWPKNGNNLPTAKRNHSGKIVSGPDEIKKLLAKEYKERLRTRPVRPDMKSLKSGKLRIFKMKMLIAESNKTPPWKMSQLEAALSHLKNNKSRDFEGYINEIFKPNNAGDDLKEFSCSCSTR